MAQRYPYQRPQEQERREFGRGSRFQGGADRDRYQTGGEHRYSSEWDDPYRRDQGFEGDRAYSGGGYSEETGYRREGRDERDEFGAQRRGYPYQGSGHGRGYSRGEFSGEQSRGFGEWTGPSGWDDVADDGGGYYGTGHQGGGFGTAAGTRAIGRDPYAPSGSGIDFYGRRSYSSAGDRWQSRSERGGRDYSDYGAGTSEGYGQRYRSQGRFGGPTDYGYGSSRFSGGYGSEDFGGSRQQSFRGRGPKGYQRTDDRLKELICECLMEDPNIDASEVTIEVSGSVVTLSGTVDDRHTKYRIEEAAESVGGVRDINNQLRVQPQSSWQSQSGSQGQSSGTGSEASSARSSGSSTGTGSSTSSTQGTGSTSKRN
jgi:osmotically-inducible protein OsmY